ncbi:F-box protein [Salix suchowensis]|nr:F-box protein [Salix suchowensis]
MELSSGSVVGGVPLNDLPEECWENVLSFTTPRDVCRLCAVSPIFKSAAESDVVWQSFLPQDLESILSTSPDASILMSSASSKKEVYFSLCDYPIIVDNWRKSFSLEKKSGKRCYMLSARDLTIVWGDTPPYWRWNSDPSSRFGEVAELISVCWLEIRGKINATMLSPATLYTAYLVFRPTGGVYGLDYHPVEVRVGLVGSESGKRNVYLDSESGCKQQYHFVRRHTRIFNRGRIVGMPASEPARESDGHYPKKRGDGWLEIELGDFFCKEGEDGELEMNVQEVKSGNWKGGLIVEGIEIRPKEDT